ncbi:virulence-associated protein E [Mammaliicoccus sciuri]|uniref:virulence-associated E family protein n=1 Tax=Mammaliicoccus sciuri TaxID=1296 RepID=UPI000E6A4934|nr:virulence-associated E family protein [Mammaliicoccus sciuri]RIO10113.1 virulence-associated protein E [Mammaliicoccus sciuri]
MATNNIELDQLIEKSKSKVISISDEKRVKADWLSSLRVSPSTGAHKSTTTNGEIILRNDEKLKDMLQYDSFEKITKLKRLPYWRSSDDKNYDWSDMDTVHVKAHIDRCYNIQFSTDVLNEVIDKEAYSYKFHPIKTMIESKEWDGTKRIETLFIDYLGAPDTHYSKEVAKKMMMGAVARIYNPGIKFDTMTVLYGGQGIGKSTLVSKLGGDWYNESIKSFSGDEAYKKIQGSWICEIAELSAFNSSTVEDIKSFVSATIDIFRASYGRRTERHPRQCIFIGTTNKHEFLKDKTGNRRFWPITTNESKITKSPFDDLTQEIVQQMYAEAKIYFDENPTEKALLLDKEATATALQIQNEHAEKDDLVGEIEAFLERPIPSNYWNMPLYEMRSAIDRTINDDDIKTFEGGTTIQVGSSKPGAYMWRDRICSKEIWKVMMKRDDQPKVHESRRIEDALRDISYCSVNKKRMRFGKNIGRQYGFEIDMKEYHENM